MQQLDLFDEAFEKSVVYPKGTEVKYTPDTPPKVGVSDFHWWIINRHAEWCAQWLSALGLY